MLNERLLHFVNVDLQDVKVFCTPYASFCSS